MNRQATISIGSLGPKFELRRFDTQERLSEPFVITVEGYAESEIDFLEHLGETVAIEVGDQGEHSRYFHGLLTEAAFVKGDGAGSHYRLTVRPWLALLQFNRNYRIFQDMTVVDIAKQVFSDLGMSDVRFAIRGLAQKRTYCVQYKESDFDFLSRLFEDEGYYYFFEHGAAEHKLVVCDQLSVHDANPGLDRFPVKPASAGQGYDEDTLGEWSEVISTGSEAKISLNSYNFETPSTQLAVSAAAPTDHKVDALEVYDYFGDYGVKAVGEARAGHRLQAARALRRVFHGAGEATNLMCGATIHVVHPDIDRFSGKYTLIAVRHHVDVEASRSGESGAPNMVQIEAIPHAVQFRAPLTTPRPRAYGPETATVTGPAGEVIYVDKFGRVKVQFHWDRMGKKDENSSCWIRVSDGSAGKGFGHITLPRIGEEVVVDFLNGDPDQPLITGRVYNAEQVTPYALPANKTRSTWRAASVPPTGVSKGFNEIRFENKDAAEEIYVHAQKDRLTEVLNNDRLVVKNNRTDRIENDRKVNVANNEDLTIEKGDMTTTVSTGMAAFEVSKGNSDTKVKMGDYTITCDLGSVAIEAMTSITLKCGESSIVMTPMDITIKALTIMSNAELMNTTQGMVVQSTADGFNEIKGGLVLINS